MISQLLFCKNFKNQLKLQRYQIFVSIHIHKLWYDFKFIKISIKLITKDKLTYKGDLLNSDMDKSLDIKSILPIPKTQTVCMY